MFGFITLLSVICYIVVNSRITKMMNKPGTITVEIDEQGVRYLLDNNKFELNWDDIKAVVINNNSINFIPKKTNKTFIGLDIRYRNEIEESINQLNKNDLLIDNSNK